MLTDSKFKCSGMCFPRSSAEYLEGWIVLIYAENVHFSINLSAFGQFGTKLF